jgi:hypothetical protein
MSRIIIPERSLPLSKILDLPSSPPHHSPPGSIFRNKTLSISKKVKQALQITTSTDDYNQKAETLFKATHNLQDTEAYLKNLIPEKERKHGFLEGKITHLAKMFKKEFLDEQMSTKKNENQGIHRKNNFSFQTNELTIINNNYNNIPNTNNNTLNFSGLELINNATLTQNYAQKRFNKILYSENYVERLLARYDNYLEKSKVLNEKLESQIRRHWDTVLKEKNKQPKYYEDLKKENAEVTERLMRETRFRDRNRERIKRFHKKKYFSMWNANQIPVNGIAYDKK